MTDYWKTIQERLHEESGLKHPLNQMGQMLEVFFNGILNQFSNDNRTFLDQGFLITAKGIYLDLKGDEFGLYRYGGEYAEGNVQFTLTREIKQTETPTLVTNSSVNGVVFDFTPKSVQDALTEINTERRESEDYTTILEIREATAKFTIPAGIIIYSDTGFEYILLNDVEFEVGDSMKSGKVRALDTGENYNAEAKSLKIFDNTDINSDFYVINTEPIKGGKEDENDNEFRRRILNNSNNKISVNYLKRQGILVYAKKNVDDEIRTKTTSFNPYVSNKYACIPPDNEVKYFVNEDLIAGEWIMTYEKGW